MDNNFRNKDILKWLLEQKEHNELIILSKKLKLKIDGFREINVKIPETILIKEITRKVMSLTKKDKIDFIELEITNKELIINKIKENKAQLKEVLENLITSLDPEKHDFAMELYREFVNIEDNKEVENELTKKIEELEKENFNYKNSEKRKEEFYLKQKKNLEKMKISIEKKEDEISKLNKKTIYLINCKMKCATLCEQK